MLTIYQTQNSLDLELPPKSIDLVITSPPIYIVENHLDEMFSWVARCISDKGVAIIDIPALYNKHNQIINRYNVYKGREKPLQYRDCVNLDHFYMRYEVMSLFFYSVDDIDKLNRIPYRKFNERSMRHRAEYDEVLAKFLIETYSNRGDTVLDLFCGTGVVPRTAYKSGRNGIGIDRRCPFTNELGGSSDRKNTICQS